MYVSRDFHPFESASFGCGRNYFVVPPGEYGLNGFGVDPGFRHYPNNLLAIRGGDAKNILEYIRIYIVITANIIAIALDVWYYILIKHSALLLSYSPSRSVGISIYSRLALLSVSAFLSAGRPSAN
jgi:hypothetical protein